MSLWHHGLITNRCSLGLRKNLNLQSLSRDVNLHVLFYFSSNLVSPWCMGQTRIWSSAGTTDKNEMLMCFQSLKIYFIYWELGTKGIINCLGHSLHPIWDASTTIFRVIQNRYQARKVITAHYFMESTNSVAYNLSFILNC